MAPSQGATVPYALRMRMRSRSTLVVITTLSMLVLALLTAAPVGAQGLADCTLRVRPGNGAPGTEFTFSGSGYAPTQIVLKRQGGPTRMVQVTPTDSDKFSIRLVAGQNDSGTWKATAIEPDVCRGTTTFTVGLPSTSTEDPTSDGLRSAGLAGFAALGALFVLSSLVVLPRMARSVRSR
jgi:hypothetical protein